MPAIWDTLMYSKKKGLKWQIKQILFTFQTQLFFLNFVKLHLCFVVNKVSTFLVFSQSNTIKLCTSRKEILEKYFTMSAFMEINIKIIHKSFLRFIISMEFYIKLSFQPSILSIYLSIHLSIYLSIYSYLYSFIYKFVFLSIYLIYRYLYIYIDRYRPTNRQIRTDRQIEYDMLIDNTIFRNVIPL